MTARFATDEEITHWDDLLVKNLDAGNVFQSYEMAETKLHNGWRARYIVLDKLYVTVLEKRLPTLGYYWYLPKGPGVNSFTGLIDVLPMLRDFAYSRGVFAVKLEPEIIETEQAVAALTGVGLVKTSSIQPNVSTVLIDLSPSLDDIMASFNQKGRHAIHRAERDGVIAQAVEASEENMRIMFDLLASTAAGRFESSLRSYKYYRAFWQSFIKNDRGSLFFAYVDGQVVASAFCMYLGKRGLYKDGASIRAKTVYGASHLLQWEVMKWMKQHKVTSYDLCGTPHSQDINNKKHSFYGIGRFKTSFNKSVTDYVGCYDLVVKPGVYRVWQKIGQRLTLSLSYRLKRQQWF
ncbi:MAG: peptidoglycan bridge formation glycyltransferase FemA/FemB family protein [Candidatus Saccharimonas sp.]